MWLWWLDRERYRSPVRRIHSSPTERSSRSTASNRLQLFICSPCQITATPLLVDSVFLLPRRIHTRLPSMTSQYHRFFLILHILRFLEMYKFQLNFSFYKASLLSSHIMWIQIIRRQSGPGRCLVLIWPGDGIQTRLPAMGHPWCRSWWIQWVIPCSITCIIIRRRRKYRIGLIRAH